MFRSKLESLQPQVSRHRIDVLLVGLCCLFAFFGAAWVSSSVFDRLPHTEDESAFLFQAQTIASGQIVAEAPEVPEAFSIPFIINRDGMWFGKYPPGYPLMLAAGVLLGHTWLVNASAAALAVVLVYLLTRRLYGPNTARIAAPLLALSPFLLLQAGSLLSHVVSLCWTLLFLLLYPLARRQQGALLPLAAGAAIGMLFLTRPLTAVGVAIPYLIWTLASVLRQRRIQQSFLFMALAALPFLIAYLAYNNLTTGSPFRTAYELWWPFDRIGFGPDKGINGHDLDDAWRNTRVNANSLAAYLFGWPGRTSLAPAFATVIASLLTLLIGGLRRARKIFYVDGEPSPEIWDLILAGVVLGVVGVHVFYWTPGQMYGPRYFMEAIGPLVILTARCFEQVRQVLAVRLFRGRRAESWLAVALVVVSLTIWAYTAWAPDEFDRFRGWNDITGEELALVESRDLHNAVVLVEREAWTDYAPFFARNQPTLDGDVVYASDVGQQITRRLMEHYPEREFYRFADGELSRIE